MSELNREQIIKALECCHSSAIADCKKCPYKGKADCEEDLGITCLNVLIKDTLSLIKELIQANEQLSESYDHLEKTKDELLSERARLTEENERLRAELEQRPPRLVITKLQKGSNDENSKDTVTLQEREADHHI